TSKVLSHEMKEALYSDLVQANQAEQQSLRATTEKADEMIRSLDGCICELEAAARAEDEMPVFFLELAQVVEKGSEDSPSLKSLQQENHSLVRWHRQISELEAQMTENSKKLRRLKAEAENLENHITAMHMLSEWRSGDASDSCAVYTFLYDTFHLQLAYEDPSEINVPHLLKLCCFGTEKSQDYAHMVHRLLSQYTQGEPDWVKTYPTDRHVPKLLLDVGLVVGRCRLLGEELRLLKMWGGLRLDILHISCVDTLVHSVFSSLKNFKKFEVVFSVSLSDHHYVLHLHSFKNMIGDTTLQQVEDIVASVTPGKNLLTKTLKKIYENLPQ
uniref:Knl1 C-terminal RWD domain-containing protein n=1 Tax=Tetraodon nigroviridis TaxID=99883 RepID=H3C760_TETNG